MVPEGKLNTQRGENMNVDIRYNQIWKSWITIDTWNDVIHTANILGYVDRYIVYMFCRYLFIFGWTLPCCRHDHTCFWPQALDRDLDQGGSVVVVSGPSFAQVWTFDSGWLEKLPHLVANVKLVQICWNCFPGMSVQTGINMILLWIFHSKRVVCDIYIYIQSICPLINDNASFDWSNHGFPGNTFELRCVTSGNCILPVMVLHLFIKFGRLWESIWFKLSLYRYKKHIWNIFQPLWMTHNIQQVALFCTVFQIKLVPSTSPWCGGLWSPARRSWTEDPRQWEDLEPTMYSWI